jgi:sulfatase modifying factor 1
MVILLIILSLLSKPTLHEVTFADFEKFVAQTGYITDAEKFGWTFRQKSIYNYDVVYGLNWKNCRHYDGNVIQVSYKDAKAYCTWSNSRLPTVEEYWRYSTASNKRDVWDWTSEGYLAGGSYLCGAQTCAGFKEGNEKKDLSKITSNSHIGFCVLQK